MRRRALSADRWRMDYPLLPIQGGQPVSRTYDYTRLMQVSLENTYYTPTYECPDFSVSATEATVELMKNIGLLLLRERAGFSVLYDRNRRKNLLSYLARQRTPRGLFETRLSFTLRLETAAFPSFTRIPATMTPSTSNFYFSNQHAHTAGRRILLTRGRFVQSDELMDVVPVQVPVRVDEDVERVEIVDIFGDVVSCVPRCVPVRAAEELSPDQIDCQNVRHFEPGPEVCRNTIYLDFASLPEDAYTIRVVKRGGRLPIETPVLYTAPMQYCFINLLLSEPAGSTRERGIYPVRGLGGRDPSIVPVRYDIAFQRRRTYWRYYVVLPPKTRTAGGLTIRTEPPHLVTFTGPMPVVLATSTPAFLFVSERPVPLSRTPPARFILHSDDGVLMQSMPVAPAGQILPSFCFCDYSDIYVYV